MSQERTPALELVKICKEFPGVKALRDVSIKAFPGEAHALIGENGAGKSTLMNIVMGVLKPDSGTLRRDGRDIVIDSPVAVQRLGIGMVPQELTLVPQLTVMENINLGAIPAGPGGLWVNWRGAAKRAEEALAMVGGGDIGLSARVGELGGARQQLVQIARAMIHRAKILIFDEPTASLTDRESERLFSLIDSFRAGGGAVFYISHRMEEIKRVCDRVTVLRDGCHVLTARADELSVADMIRHMVGRDVESGANNRCFAPEGKPVVLEAESLTRRGEFEDVSFTLRKGEILGFAGLVGAGRTEVMKCVIGDTLPDRGRVVVNGSAREGGFRHPSDSIVRGVAYLPEERRAQGIFPVLGVAENMALPSLADFSRWYRGISSRLRNARVDSYIRDLNIKTPGRNQMIRNLSGGNQQKAVLARWLLKGCRILILDEPTRGIDVNAKKEIHDLLRGIVKDGDFSIILVSSELQELLDACDRIVVMNLGRVKGEIAVTPSVDQETVMRLALA